MSSTTRTARVVAMRALLGSALLVALVWPAVSTAASLTLPKGVTEADAKRMYAEQLDSQASIKGLVGGDVVTFNITGRTVTANTADLQLRVVNKSGVVRRGVMKLFKADGKWYFSTISRTGTTSSADSSTDGYDVGVLNTILAEQTAHSDSTAKLVDGTYQQVRVGKPKAGHNSVVLPVIFNGKGRRATTGEITAVKRTSGGEDAWFVVSFNAR